MITAVSGHRPPKLGGYTEKVNLRLITLAIKWLSANRPDEVISGMALGWDLAIAEAAVILGIPFIAAVPCPTQSMQWPMESRTRWDTLFLAASRVHIVSPEYTRTCMQERNIWMVDNSTQLLALWDGSPGGTGNCIKYASGKLPIVNLWDIYIQGVI